MEITCNYNILEIVGFLFLIFFSGFLVVRLLGLIWINGKFKSWW